MVAKAELPEFETLADVHERLGFVDLHRIRARPAPGTATEKDLLALIEKGDKKRYELVDGYIVEKEAMGRKESLWASHLVRILGNFVAAKRLGNVLGPDDLWQLRPGLVRSADVCFIPWSRVDGDELADDPIGAEVPTLTVEVLSRSNRRSEIDQKLAEYLAAGVKMCWVIDPKSRSARIYSSAKRWKDIDPSGALDGGRVVPGFVLPLAEFFAEGKKPRPGAL